MNVERFPSRPPWWHWPAFVLGILALVALSWWAESCRQDGIARRVAERLQQPR